MKFRTLQSKEINISVKSNSSKYCYLFKLRNVLKKILVNKKLDLSL